MKTSDIIIGLALIAMGILFLSDNFGYFDLDFGRIWPLVVVIAGAGFWIGYLNNRKNYGLLMPGTILIVYGLMFWYCAAEGWYNMQYIWPGFMIGPGLGFFMMYFLGDKERGLLVPAAILTGIGLLFILGATDFAQYWPVFLIAGGVYLIYKHYRQKSSGEN